ncbi:choice-of-anchor I family protein [uncultured Desulfosarcina sp.]|uniref:choice-of-anchor I family protein n=1 Tax=uncultured Desulfosarcina sp. TaxID=218289 RepID=UPI0029C6AAF5|nr:choice-of-anchor I family protein [uncultured Desulfosarcina sp.]
MYKRLIFTLLVAVLLFGGSAAKALAATRFAVFADPHYYDNALGTEGEAFEAYLAGDRKLIRESEALVQAVVEQILAAHAEKPLDFVIVPGDLTKDGALSSHLEFAAYLAEIEAAGIPVFVCPGNHDINNPHAYSYDGDTATAVDNVSPEAFASIYGAFGYGEALSYDPNSLSYAVEPVPGIVLLSLDSCKYADNIANGSPETGGAFSDETLDWAVAQIGAAKTDGKQVIAFQHHGLAEHYIGQSDSFSEYVIDNFATVSAALADAGLKLDFSGHYHANDITMTTGSTDDAVLYDIETGSLVTAPCPYRIVTLHGKNAAQVETRYITEIDYDTGGVSFPEYARGYLYDGLLGIAQYSLENQYGLNAATADYLAPYVADAFAAHYAGDEQPDDGTQALILGFLSDTNATTQYLGQMLYTLWTDLAPTDNRALIPLDPKVALSVLGTYASGLFGESSAEIVAFDPATKRLFVSNAEQDTVDALNIADPANPAQVFTIDLSPYGGGVNSVAVNNGIVAVAVQAEVKQYPGTVVFFDTNGHFLNQVTVGALPDMLTFTPDGRKVLVANEGEPSSDYTIDPEGSVSIIDISRGIRRARVKTAGFEKFNKCKDKLVADGVRIFGPNATVAQDLEPEYIAVAEDSSQAWVTLQENNAVAVLNLRSGRITDVLPLGVKDHGMAGNGIDASNKDDAINIANYDNLFGMFLPDAIAAYGNKGGQYLVTANEGDAREYDAFVEEAEVGDLDLNPEAFPDADPDAESIQHKTRLGKLKVTTTLGDLDGDGTYEELYAYGARSFSIFTPTKRGLRLVFDSGDQLEQLTAAALPFDFNSTNDENDSFDDRSDNKGPEPEGLTLGEIDGRTYLFLGLERVGGIMVYDITDAQSPEFVQYINNRDFDAEDIEDAGDLAPEGLVFIPACKSPTGDNLLAVANEVSGTTTVYKIDVEKRRPHCSRGHHRYFFWK